MTIKPPTGYTLVAPLITRVGQEFAGGLEGGYRADATLAAALPSAADRFWDPTDAWARLRVSLPRRMGRETGARAAGHAIRAI